MTTTWNVDTDLKERIGFDEGTKKKMLNLISADNQFNVAEVNISPDGEGVKVAYSLNFPKAYAGPAFSSPIGSHERAHEQLQWDFNATNRAFKKFGIDGVALEIQKTGENGTAKTSAVMTFESMLDMTSALNFGNGFAQRHERRQQATS